MYFVIEGVIGVGKTTLARMLQNHLMPIWRWKYSKRIPF